MGAMYSLNIYEIFEHGDFKLLETKYVYAENRDDAKRIVFEYATEKYKDREINVVNNN